MKNLNLTISSKVENILTVQNFIEQLINEFKLPEKIFGRINLTTIEAVNNSIIHGNQLDQSMKVIIEAEMKAGEIIISVSDEGIGFDFTHIPNPTLPENIMKSSGRGLYLMKVLSDSLEFQNNGSKVIMSFSLK